ncbi:hypothetical protein [Mycovorax composti]|uniref:hypothetical protein n=1 Tax=Mycovorax composti TaxID=2962693 RepID=UPI00391F732C
MYSLLTMHTSSDGTTSPISKALWSRVFVFELFEVYVLSYTFSVGLLLHELNMTTIEVTIPINRHLIMAD